jgi:hypothetical protein
MVFIKVEVSKKKKMFVIINKMKVENDGHQFYQEVIYSLKKVMCHSLYNKIFTCKQ